VVDPAAAQRNLDRFRSASGVTADAGEAPALVDRALAAREARRQGS